MTYWSADIRQRPDQTSTASFRGDTDNLAAASQEIERQSARIQREMALERRARSVSPTRGMMTSPAALPPRPTRAPTPARLQTTPAAQDSSGDSFSTTNLNLGLDVNTADKMMSQDLKVLRGALLTTKLQLREAEKEARETRTKAEEARSELMLLEFKKNTARKDLELLLDDVRRKQNLSENYRTEMNVKLNELREFQALGLTKEEVKNLQDENVNLKLRQRVMDELELERDELGRQLDSAKDDLLREQKQARLQREEMIEEIETLNSRLEETQNGWATAQQQFQKLEAAFRQMEREKNDLIQEKTKEYNALKTLTRQENKESRQFLSQELDTLTSEVQDLRTRVNSLQAEVSSKTDQNAQLREQVMSLTSQVSREKAARAAATEEQRKTLQMLRKETDHAMLQLRESMFLEKQSALEDLKAELDQERRHSLSRSDERMAQLLAENAELISEKNQEIVRLQEMLQELRQSADRRFQEKVDQQIREAVARERATIEVENQWKLRTERESLARDTKQHINEMQMALDKERETSHRLTRELSQLKEELEEQKRVSRETLKEKMAAVVRAKEQVREQSNQEIDKVKEKVKQEMQREIDRLQSKLQDSEEEVRTLRTEKQQLLGRERESVSAMDRTEKTVINEINEECRRTASLLGVLPRQVQFSTADDAGTSRTQITNALANLRANNEELRNRVEELTTELESYRNIVASAEKEKQESLESLRMEMDKKKNTELEKLKEKLIREHLEELARVAQTSARQSLANSMVGALRRKDTEIEELKAALDVWRQQAADNYTQPYKTELARELEKSQTMLLSSSREQKRINDLQQQEIARLEREVQRLAMMQNNKLASHHDRPPSPSPASQQQQLLQARIKQLQSENNELRRKHLSKHNTSVPDLSTLLFQNSPHRPASPSREQREKFRALEDRIRVGEKESLLAEERAKLSQTALSKKMDEMTKLQNTLNSQNHELLQLEQAYTQLHRQYNQSPAVTTSLILHNTR